MGMKIDESGGDHLTFNINNGSSIEPRSGNGCNPPATNPNKSNSVKIGFWIHNAPIGQHNFIGLRQQRGNEGE